MKMLALAAVCAMGLGTVRANALLDESSITLGQDRSTRLVTVNYTLTNMPAIVTVDFQTNATPTAAQATWVSIGAKNFTSVGGDVNMVVEKVNEQATIVWQPRNDLPPLSIRGENVARAVVSAWTTDAPPDYVVIDLEAPELKRYYTSEAALPYGGLTNDLYRSTHLVLRRIPAAGVTWRMGSPESEALAASGAKLFARRDMETPHYVTFTEDYWVSVFDVTRKQYQLMTGSNPGKGDEYAPANTFSYNTLRGSYGTHAIDWPNTKHKVGSESALQKMRAATGIDFDLLTSAQWEYACRAGTGTCYYWGDQEMRSADILSRYAVYAKTAHDYEYEHVGSLLPNAWGLYDMYGNIREFVLDFYEDVATTKAETDPTGPTSQANRYRVVRSSPYNAGWNTFRSAYISYTGESTGNMYFGLRLMSPMGFKFPDSEK